MRVFTAILFIVMLVFFVYAGSRIARVDAMKCSGCGDCVAVCPVDAIKIVRHRAVVDPEKCINCGLCANACPRQAIRMTEK